LVFHHGLVPIYLVAKGISLKSGLLAVWVPFLAADLGNFSFGGGVSGYLISARLVVRRAREKALVVFWRRRRNCLAHPTIFTVNLYLITLLFALATFSLRIVFHHRQRAPHRPYHSEP